MTFVMETSHLIHDFMVKSCQIDAIIR